MFDNHDGFDDDFEQLFGNATVESSSDDKIIIRDLEPRRKVRRRVKKGTKEEVLRRRQNMQADKKITIVRGDSSADVLGVNHQIDRQYSKKPVKTETNKNTNKKETKDKGVIDPSEFRNNSKKWQDYEYTEYKNAVKSESPSGIFTIVKNISAFQWVACILAVTLFVSAVMGTSVYAKSNAAENRAAAMERLASFELSESNEIAQLVESVEAPLSFEQASYEDFKILSLVLTSVEKDLKIKLVDEDDTLVRNIPWSVTVIDSENNEFQQADDDEDGIIHLTDVKAGDYSVTLNPSDELEGFEYPKEKQFVSVKAKVEYKVIQNIKEEIKTEKEVNAAVEDANGNQAADVETGPVITDTVEWCESTKNANGEEYIEATPDITKTASIKQDNKFLAVIDNLKKSAGTSLLKKGVLGTRLMYLATETGGDSSGEGAPTGGGSSSGEGTPAGGESSSGEGTPAGGESPSGEGTSTGGESSSGEGTPAGGESSSGGASQTGGGSSAGGSTGNNTSTHNHDFKYTSNNNGTHTISCGVASCPGDFETVESCTYSDGKCGKCQNTKTHTHEFKYTSANNGTHTVSCSAANCPGGFSTTENCSYSNGVCQRCQYKHSHTYKCTSNNDGTHKAVCECGYTETEKCSVSNGKCSLCGYEQETKYSDDAQLYDAMKNALYVYENGTYRLAKYRDYKSGNFSKYYRKSDAYEYTGWQTIDGKRYYYRSDHTYVTGEQIIGGVKYNFGADGALSTGSGTLGIDVSKYQPSINWQSVKASGVNYVIIRCGYRGSSTGVLVEDPYFRSHIKGAKAAGLKVGVYFFTTAVTEAEAVEEASMCAYLCNGYGLDYPIFMDCESSNRAGYNGMSAGQRTAIIKAFCNTIRSAGYTPGVYANKTWLSSYMNAGELSGYKIWLAQYNSGGPTYSGRYDMWQYTSKGSVQGISGYVDMNQSYMGY